MMFSTSASCLNPSKPGDNSEEGYGSSGNSGNGSGLVPVDSPIARAKEEEYYDALRAREKAGNAYIQANEEHSGIEDAESDHGRIDPELVMEQEELVQTLKMHGEDIKKYDDAAITKRNEHKELTGEDSLPQPG
jgi:hypothetical protein